MHGTVLLNYFSAAKSHCGSGSLIESQSERLLVMEHRHRVLFASPVKHGAEPTASHD